VARGASHEMEIKQSFKNPAKVEKEARKQKRGKRYRKRESRREWGEIVVNWLRVACTKQQQQQHQLSRVVKRLVWGWSWDMATLQPCNWQLATGSHLTMLKCSAGMFKIKALRLATKVALTMGGEACHTTHGLADSQEWQGSTMASASSIRAKEWQRNCNGIFECEVGGMVLHCAHWWLPHFVATLEVVEWGMRKEGAFWYACPCPCSTSWHGRQLSQVTHFEDLLSDIQEKRERLTHGSRPLSLECKHLRDMLKFHV